MGNYMMRVFVAQIKFKKQKRNKYGGTFIALFTRCSTSGSAAKLLLVFTHFDEVKGDNLPNARGKENHVLASAENVLASIGEELGPFAERALRCRLKEACFFVGGIDEDLDAFSAKSSFQETGWRIIRSFRRITASMLRARHRSTARTDPAIRVRTRRSRLGGNNTVSS